jgi:hypothetical protein
MSGPSLSASTAARTQSRCGRASLLRKATTSPVAVLTPSGSNGLAATMIFRLAHSSS